MGSKNTWIWVIPTSGEDPNCDPGKTKIAGAYKRKDHKLKQQKLSPRAT